MENLEVGHFRLVSGFDQCLKSGLDKCRRAAAENSLFAEEIGFGLFLERGFKNTSTGATDTLGPGEGCLFGVAALVLIDGDEGGHTLAFLILAANRMTGSLGGNHDDINMLRRSDCLEMDRKPMAEKQRVARVEIRCDVLFIDLRNGEVRDGNKDNIGLFHGLGRVIDLKAKLLGHGAAFALGVESDDDFGAALFQIECMGVSLGTEADDGAGFSLEELQIGIFVSIDFGGHGVGIVFIGDG